MKGLVGGEKGPAVDEIITPTAVRRFELVQCYDLTADKHRHVDRINEQSV